jgi:lipopolysaccharide export system protein LptA
VKKTSDRANDAASRLPGLLDQEASATVTAEALDYQGASGKAIYTGRSIKPTLSQDTTQVRGDTITIDQASGDLTATGNASSDITFEGEAASGQANEIRYVDAKRTITYAMSAVATAGAPMTARLLGALLGPRGELRARRIEIVLAGSESRADRIEAHQDVAIRTQMNTVTNADRLTYLAATEGYEVHATTQRPLVWFKRDGTQCRESTGTLLKFSKSGTDASLDGLNPRRAQTGPKPCPANLP